ncbi:hypothetical protein HAX54_002271, partial [Datura stramonium]|nr:hypothetical protein [Datura stramonium]
MEVKICMQMTTLLAVRTRKMLDQVRNIHALSEHSCELVVGRRSGSVSNPSDLPYSHSTSLPTALKLGEKRGKPPQAVGDMGSRCIRPYPNDGFACAEQ